MPYKPMPTNRYTSYLKIVGWEIKKGSIDWNLLDENKKYICTIKITHGKGAKQEVDARSVKKTEKEFKEKGWIWPPKKK